jgi:hypothetical protein
MAAAVAAAALCMRKSDGGSSMRGELRVAVCCCRQLLWGLCACQLALAAGLRLWLGMQLHGAQPPPAGPAVCATAAVVGSCCSPPRGFIAAAAPARGIDGVRPGVHTAHTTNPLTLQSAG